MYNNIDLDFQCCYDSELIREKVVVLFKVATKIGARF